jgi:hypothetical protein
VFPFKDALDKTAFDVKISSKDIINIDYQMDQQSMGEDGYTFRVECHDLTYFFCVTTAHGCLQFVEVLRKSKATIEEIQRTKFNTLKRNVDPIIHAYKCHGLKPEQKALDDIKRFLSFKDSDGNDVDVRIDPRKLPPPPEAPPEPEPPADGKRRRVIRKKKKAPTAPDIGEILNNYTEALDFMEFSLDAIQCQRPYQAGLVKGYMKNYH